MVQKKALALMLTLGGLASGCASAVESSKMEDRARRTVPVPICIQPLERSTSGVSKIEPNDYWKMVLPAFDAGSSTVDSGSNDCAGRPAFAEKDLLSAEGPRTGSLPAKPDHAVVTPGPDGFRVVWLRTFDFADGSSSGPLALVRSREGYAEVYGTGALRSKLKTTRFGLERMGSRILVTATDEGCTDAKPGQSCETAFTVFLLGAGRLNRAASLPLDRVDHRPFPGLAGMAKYRLTATPVFQDKGMRVVEQVLVQDANQGTVRKSDLERVFKLSPSGELSSNAPSLWAQVVGDQGAPPAPPVESAPAPPKGKPTNK
ncbi:MAG: uncharacterized protein K0R38_7406 [Polyangiaceae bacterium]|jgi:hypothetical protein|nr:uncharacterized protein [Polyangiaceae bacterium]